MKLYSALPLLMGLVFASSANAQQPYNPAFGSGQYPAAAPCGYGMKVPEEIKQIDKYIKEDSAELREVQRNKRKVESELREWDREIRRGTGSFADAVFAQLGNGKCTGGEPSGSPTPKQDWAGKYCQKDKELSTDVCEAGRNGNNSKCRDALSWSDGNYKYKIKKDQLAHWEREEERLKTQISDNREERERAQEDALERYRQGEYTEATCDECFGEEGGQGPSWKMALFSGALDAAMILGNYFTQKHAINRAADLGYAYYPYPTGGYGYPFFTAGLYGAAYGGIGGGSLGCAPGIGGGGNPMGPFGMLGPYGMYNPYGGVGGMMGYPPWINAGLGGSVFMPGMGPWGMACGPMSCGGPMGGMYGLGNVPGGMMGPMGMAVGGQFGIVTGGMMGYPGGMMGYPGGMMGPPGGMMGPPGGMMGPPGGMMGPPGGMMGPPGGMMGPPGMMMGPPGMMGPIGMAAGGQFGIVTGGMMGPPGGMMGYPGGMMGYPGGMMGYPGGMMGPPGGMMGPPGGMMAAGGMGMDYYNQLMQQQMMMYQMQLEYQRTYQEQTQAKYRVIMGLYTELQMLQMRLQQAYQSLYFGGAFSVGPGGGMMGPGPGTSPGGQLPPPPPGGGR